MKCSVCGKEIPVTSQVCPFCYSPVNQAKHDDENIEVLGEQDENLTNLGTVSGFDYQSNNNELNFGDLTNTSYDSNSDSLTAIYKENKKKKALIIPIIVVVFIFIGVLIFMFVLKGPTVPEYKYFTTIVDNAFEYIDDTFLSSKIKRNGTYKLYYIYDEEKNELNGKLQLDVSKKVLNISGEVEKTDQPTSIIVSDLTTNYEVNANGNDLYINVPAIFNQTLHMELPDSMGLLKNKQYDVTIVAEGIHDALNEALQSLQYKQYKNISTEVNGVKKNTNKIELMLDNPAKKKFISVFYTSIIDNQNFVHEFAKIKNVTNEQMKKEITQTMIDYETKYAYESDYYTVINFYYMKNDMYGFEIDMTNDNGNKYFVEYVKGKLVITKYENDSKSVVTITHQTDEKDGYDVDIYSLETMIDDKKLLVNFEFTDGNQENIKAKEITSSKNTNELTQEELTQIKNNFGKFTKYTDVIDIFIK